MSINVFMIPVALAMRVVMGKERFDEFVKSSELIIKTDISQEKKISNIVQLAGYDFIDYMGSKKTHLENSYFFWEIKDDKWVAVFSIYDDINQINTFKENLNFIAKRNIFQDTNKEIIEDESKINHKIYPTNFTDEAMLIKTLKDNSIEYIKNHEEFVVIFPELKMTIFRDSKAYYEVKIDHSENINKAYFYLNNIDEEYKKNIQTMAYENIIDKIKKNNDMNIESEEVLEDDSILITVICN